MVDKVDYIQKENNKDMQDSGKTKKNYFVSFLISHFIVLVLPMLIIGILFSTYFIKITNEMILEKTTEDLKRIGHNFDMQIDQLKGISQLLSNERTLTTDNIVNNPLSFFDIYESLDYTRTNNFVSDIFLYNKYGHSIYNADFVYNFKIFFNQIYQFDNMTYEEFVNLLNDLSSPTWLILRSSKNSNTTFSSIIIFAVPVYGFSNGDNIMLYMLDEKSLFPFIGEDNIDQSFTVIASYRTGIVFPSNRRNNPEFQFLIDISSDVEPDTFVEKEYNNSPYYFSYSSSIDNDLVYFRGIPSKILLKKARELQVVFIIGLFIILFFGSFVVVYFSRRNYFPIKNLFRKVKKYFVSQESNLDEFQITGLAIETLSENYNKAVKDRTILKILFNQFHNLQQLENDCEKIGIVFPAAFQRVIFINIPYLYPEINETNKFDKVISLLNKTYPCLYSYEYMLENSYVIIINDDKCDDNVFVEKIKQIGKYFIYNYNTKVTVGIGTCYNNVIDISNSFKESKIAFNYAILNPSSNIVFYKSLSSLPLESYVYPKTDLDILYKSICTADVYSFQATTVHLLQILSTSNKTNNFFIVTCLSFEITNTSIMALNEIGVDTKYLKKNYLEKLLKLDSYKPDDFYKIINDLCIKVAEYLREYESQQLNSFSINNILAYIEENFANQNLTVKNLADKFNISVSNLSHQYKNKVNKNLSLSIDELRLKKATYLLKTTDLTLENIATQVGYIHPANLIRKFKQFYNQTPTEYRNNKHP